VIRIVAVCCGIAGIAVELMALFGGDAVGQRWTMAGLLLILMAGALTAAARGT
jgi:hypothetical protein